MALNFFKNARIQVRFKTSAPMTAHVLYDLGIESGFVDATLTRTS